MTREDGVNVIHQLINSGILDEELETELKELAQCICEDNFEACIGTEYCENCKFRAPN